MENSGAKLASIVDEITESEIIKSQVLYAKFQNALKESYHQKIQNIENDFMGKANFYGKSEGDCISEKNAILSKYEEDFQKIFDSRRLQYINIQNEIQELVANKLIAIANFKQIAKSKSEFVNSPTYVEYLNKKQKFENIVETTLNHEEFDNYTKLLEELQDPLETYQRKLVALASKYDNYDATIIECEKKLDECLESALGDFEEITRYVDSSLSVVKKENIIMKFINKFLSKVNGNAKFEKNVVQKMKNELLEIEEDISESVEIIDDQTINIVAAIEEIRANINTQFDSAME